MAWRRERLRTNWSRFIVGKLRLQIRVRYHHPYNVRNNTRRLKRVAPLLLSRSPVISVVIRASRIEPAYGATIVGVRGYDSDFAIMILREINFGTERMDTRRDRKSKLIVGNRKISKTAFLNRPRKRGVRIYVAIVCSLKGILDIHGGQTIAFSSKDGSSVLPMWRNLCRLN